MVQANNRLNHYVDLDRYPIHELDSGAGQSLIAECHEMMATDTLCLLEGFLREIAVSELCEEISSLQSDAHAIHYPSTPYGWMNNAGFPPDHPRSQLPLRKCDVITTELLHPDGRCMELYQFDQLTEFIRRLLRYDTLYRVECPTLAVQINVMGEGDVFGWHFDTNDGVVSFTIQNPDCGGGFEYAPLIRDEENENYDRVGRVLNNADAPRRPDMLPGTFSLFLGRRSLHRVAPVGPTRKKRQSLLFSYDRKPGFVFPKTSQDRLTSESPEPYLGQQTPA